MSWRERFREENELLCAIFGPVQRKITPFIGILSFFYQAQTRWELCESIVSADFDGPFQAIAPPNNPRSVRICSRDGHACAIAQL
jgi:hypothetical protein